MSEPQDASSSSNEVDYIGLCEDIVRRMKEVMNRGKVLNERQCRHLAFILGFKLSCIRTAVDACEPESKLFYSKVILAPLHRYYEKAEVLVKQCAEEDWCAASIFQDGNDVSIKNILSHVDFWGLQLIKHLHGELVPPTFNAVGFFSLVDQVDRDVGADKEELRMRLERVERGLATEQVALRQQHLARYLLKKHEFQSVHKTPTPDMDSLDVLKPILWEQDKEPVGTWGHSKFLGSGSGASGVCKTSWLGVPCAKKEFHGEESLKIFVKEALIMAQLKHPCIVDFMCCGNGDKKGDRYIAMELMEKSLFDLIEERKGVHFPHAVALDIMLQIADGVRYLHDNGVAHRDLKPHNVVVKMLRSLHHKDTYYCVKLVDFGISKSEVEASKSNIVSYQGIGTTRYRAPEVHPDAHPGRVNWFKADAYSFAMTCAHILTLKPPYEDIKPFSTLYMELLDGRRPSLPSDFLYMLEVLEKCWCTTPSKRLGFHTIYQMLNDLKFGETFSQSCTIM